MPELPEVETIRLGLQPLLQNRTIVGFQRYRDELRFPIPDLSFALGWQVAGLVRRSKYLLLLLSNDGVLQGRLLLHLGMSGQLHFFSEPVQIARHDHWCLQLQNGLLLYRDQRRFGRISWFGQQQEQDLQRLLARVGPEPLTPFFTAAGLFSASRHSRQSVKVWLLAGRAVCGVGNIYSCESLFAAGVDPFKPAQQLSWGECVHLSMAIRAVLQRALCAGGTTLRDFRNALGQPGYFQQQLWVYGREGAPCLRCQQSVQRQDQAGRSTFFCPQCQGSTVESKSLFAARPVREPAYRHPQLRFDETDVVLRSGG